MNAVRKTRTNISLENRKDKVLDFLEKEIKNNHVVRLTSIAKELGVTTQRASIILKLLDIDLKALNKEAFDKYNEVIVKRIMMLHENNALSKHTYKTLYELLDYKFTIFDFKDLVKPLDVKLRYDTGTVFLKDLFKQLKINTSDFTINELYEKSGLSNDMKFNSFRVNCYKEKLPYKRRYNLTLDSLPEFFKHIDTENYTVRQLFYLTDLKKTISFGSFQTYFYALNLPYRKIKHK